MAREATWNAVRRSRDDATRQETYNSAIDECSKGWMNGPFFQDLSKDVKLSATLSDGSKVMKARPIHDFSESLINVTKCLLREDSTYGG